MKRTNKYIVPQTSVLAISTMQLLLVSNSGSESSSSNGNVNNEPTDGITAF